MSIPLTAMDGAEQQPSEVFTPSRPVRDPHATIERWAACMFMFVSLCAPDLRTPSPSSFPRRGPWYVAIWHGAPCAYRSPDGSAVGGTQWQPGLTPTAGNRSVSKPPPADPKVCTLCGQNGVLEHELLCSKRGGADKAPHTGHLHSRASRQSLLRVPCTRKRHHFSVVGPQVRLRYAAMAVGRRPAIFVRRPPGSQDLAKELGVSVLEWGQISRLKGRGGGGGRRSDGSERVRAIVRSPSCRSQRFHAICCGSRS